MKNKILSQLRAECPWRDTLYWYDAIDSTNSRLKAMAREGAPQGTVVLAGHQTQGRGRLGRSFSSPENQGVYLSLLLRPHCRPEDLMHLTCAVGVAARRAIQAVSGLDVKLKWINDLVYDRRKLGGILTELSVCPATGRVEWAVVGIGINCLQKEFPSELENIALSLAQAGKAVSPDVLAGQLIYELWLLSQHLLEEKQVLMAQYRRHCITLGKQVRAIRGDEITCGTALDVTDDGALLLQTDGGNIISVLSGEVSIRGKYEYLS